jgi:mono/diheme cytochrome c family protein
MRRSVAVGTGVRAGLWALSLLLVLAWPSQALRAGDSDDDDSGLGAKFSPEAAATFNGRCTACHTYGNGIKVGPDLKGATERRKRDWLLKFIHASSGVIKSGDPTATALFAQFKQQRMPDWVDLSDKQINDILDYIAIGGPDIKPADERNAATATSAETDAGRKLFYGEMQTRYGAQACVNCHSVRGTGLRGGSLGPDLTGVYLRYQDPGADSIPAPYVYLLEDPNASRALPDSEGILCAEGVSPRVGHADSTKLRCSKKPSTP